MPKNVTIAIANEIMENLGVIYRTCITYTEGEISMKECILCTQALLSYAESHIAMARYYCLW